MLYGTLRDVLLSEDLFTVFKIVLNFLSFHIYHNHLIIVIITYMWLNIRQNLLPS